MFQPSRYSHYGASSGTGTSLVDRAEAALAQAAPALSIAGELLGKSTTEKIAILQAKIVNYQRAMKRSPTSIVPGAAWYRAEIEKMKAELGALQGEAAQEAASSADYGRWRTITTVGGVVGVGLGLAAGYYLLRRANA